MEHNEGQEIPTHGVITRGRMMVNCARRSSGQKRLFEDRGTSTFAVTTEVKKRRVMERQTAELRDIDAKLVTTKYDKKVGSGTYGECYLGSYKGIDVVIKEMKSQSNNSSQAKREVIREGRVISALGDHEGLPLLFGAVTGSEPYGLVFKFHNVEGESISLSHAANEKLLTEKQCLRVF